MMPDDDGVIGYAVAANTYWEAGWRGILPLRRGTKGGSEANLPVVHCDKHRPKTSRSGTMACPDCVHYTGYAAVDPSYPDILQWTETRPVDNLCLHLPDGIIGIDVDAYGAKTGAAALLEAIRRWGPLPPTVRSTSREDPVSGIRLYRVPPGTLLEDTITFPELGIGDIELIQRHHRYVVCWPSIHPEKRPYWWRDDATQFTSIPNPAALPPLPPTWIDGLKVTPRSLTDNYDIKSALTTGEASPAVRTRFTQAVKELNLPGCSRHNTALRHVMAMLRLGKSGEPGVEPSLVLLREVFIAATGVDGSRTPDGARVEFNRMITNPNAARELAQPGVLDWMREIVKSQPPPPEPEPVPAPEPKLSRLQEIEQDFWTSRESLNAIYTAALARMCSPWAVLSMCVARTLAQVKPNWTLPPLIGGPGSLNWFAIIADTSSGGKTSSMSLARQLITGDVRERQLGSGEGMIGAYYKPALKAGETAEINVSNMFVADEVDTVTALGARTGQTTMTVLRSAFSGETLGFSYIAKGRDVHLKAHSYRMTLVVSVQPGRAGGLLDDHYSGTPQRFMWFPANDDRISRETQSFWVPGPLSLPELETYPRELTLPQEAIDEILDERVRNGRGEVGVLDGHSLFCQEKLAFALALLDGRVEMSLEDWRLSGIASAVSKYTRQWVAAGLSSARTREAEDRGEVRGIELHAADNARDAVFVEQVTGQLDWALRKIRAAGEEGIPKRNLWRASDSRRRKALDAALTQGQFDGLFILDGATYRLL
jgi:hypothetical protein